MEFSLPNGVKMEVVGRIDRVDKAEDENGTFLRIIDYKSSLDLTEVYYGLALQMLTYLDVVTRMHRRGWKRPRSITSWCIVFPYS